MGDTGESIQPAAGSLSPPGFSREGKGSMTSMVNIVPGADEGYATMPFPSGTYALIRSMAC